MRRVDQEHAAGGQARADHFALFILRQLAGLDGQRGVQPGFAGLVGQGFQLFRQVVRFGTRDDGVPHRIGAGGKALHGVGNHGHHAGVVVFDLVAGVAQHQGATGGRGKELFQAFKTILAQDGDLTASFELGDVGGQCLDVGGMHFPQLELVAAAQQTLDDEGRAGIHTPVVGGVEARDHVNVVLQGWGVWFFGLGGHQLEEAFGRLGTGFGVIAVQAVQPGARMGVKHVERVFLRHVAQHRQQNGVLENVGMVAGMEGVAITEHGGMVTFQAPNCLNCQGFV